MTDNPASLVERLDALIEQRKAERALSKQKHPTALQVSVAGENRVCRAIADLAPKAAAALKAKDEQIARLEAERTAAIAAAYRKGLEDAAVAVEGISLSPTRAAPVKLFQQAAARIIRALDTQDSGTTHAGEKA